ncbi:MAG: diaminopimelate epimerase [Firmicutes bacterium]|nr:diaminopimelate epimerase [Bacillota bacterium]
MKVSKYHGCGNSFVIIRESGIPAHIRDAEEAERLEAYGQLAVQLCDINTGIGADGFIVVREEPELEMVFFNQDGSRAPMCGNGIRCFAEFCMNEGIREEAEYPVKTLAGDMVVEITQDEPFRARINMGSPNFDPEKIAVKTDKNDMLGAQIPLKDGSAQEVDSFFMGTIHTVVFTDEIDREKLEPVGEEICNHELFGEKTNVNFVKIVDEDSIQVLTYERGVGITLACGTGACASVVAASRRGYIGKSADVQLALGTLKIDIEEDGSVFMEGPSVRVFDGQLGS